MNEPNLTLREKGKSYLLNDASYYESQCKEYIEYIQSLKQENDKLKEALKMAVNELQRITNKYGYEHTSDIQKAIRLIYNIRDKEKKPD